MSPTRLTLAAVAFVMPQIGLTACDAPAEGSASDENAVCYGTTIVAVRTPEVFAMAADGEGTFKGRGMPTTSRLVSKIFQKAGLLYAISGLTKDANRGFDPAAAIASFISVPQPLRKTANDLERILSNSLRNELTTLRAEEPALFRHAVEGDSRGTSILLACWENEEPLAIAIHFLGVLDEEGKLTIRTTRLACPGDCPNGTFTFFLGHHTAIDKYASERGNRIPMSPEESVRFFVQLEIDAGTPGVGLPIDIVRLDRNGISWLSGKSNNE